MTDDHQTGYNDRMALVDTFTHIVSDGNAPLVVFVAHSDNDVELEYLKTEVYLQSKTEFSSIIKSNIDWNKFLSPWPCDRIVKGVGSFLGKADVFLRDLEDEVSREIAMCRTAPSAVYIAGYSLAGLFALYSLYKTDLFDGAACCSGSLWFPGFVDFVKNNEFRKSPKRLYMSLGDKEASVKNSVFASVGDKTREVYEYYKQQGINVKFEMNSGNHMTDVADRVSKGISSLLTGWSKE